MTHPVQTPWGPSQTATEIAPGIIAYTTASHGGYWLSPERIASMPKCLRDFVPFGGPQSGPGRWYEEDCDWAVVALAFPQFFPADAIPATLKTLERYKPELYKQVVAMRSEGRGMSIAECSDESCEAEAKCLELMARILRLPQHQRQAVMRIIESMASHPTIRMEGKGA